MLHTAVVSRTHYDAIVDKVRRLLRRGPFGVHGVRQLSHALGVDDEGDDGSVCVTRDAFVAALSLCGVVLSDAEVLVVCAQLAHRRQTATTTTTTTASSAHATAATSARDDAAVAVGIDAVLFVAALRTRLTPLRRAWVLRVWSMFDKQPDGRVALDVLQAAHRAPSSCYDNDNDNDKYNNSSADGDDDDDALRAVCRAVGDLATTFCAATRPRRAVGADEFTEYCAGVSSACDGDALFVAYMRHTWWWWWAASSVRSSHHTPATTTTMTAADAARTPMTLHAADTATTTTAAAARDMTYTEHDTLARKQAVARARALHTRLQRLVEDVHRPCVLSSALRVRRLTLSLRRRDMTARRADGTAAAAVESGFVSRRAFCDALRENRLYMTTTTATTTTLVGDSAHDKTAPTSTRATAAAAANACVYGDTDGRTSTVTECDAHDACAQLLDALDTNGDGSVDYVYYLALLLPPLPATRHVALTRLWTRVLPAKDVRGAVDVYALQRCFCAHEAATMDAFCAAWDVRAAVGGVVRYDELVEWYTPLSHATALDTAFDSLLAQQWRKPTNA